MRKSRLFTAGVLALTLALGLFLAGCDTGAAAAAKVTVTFNKNGAEGSAPAEKTVDKGSRITIPDEGGLYLNGSTFTGWNSKRDGSGDLYEEGDRMTVNDDVTLYAQWRQGGNNPGTNNPFNATSWSGADSDGDSVTLTFTNSAWTLTWTDYGDTENGSYTYSGNVATFQFQGTAGTATIAGNSLTVVVGGSTMMTLTSGSGNNNPGGGDTAVIFSNVTANGSSSQTTTQLTLTFSQAITSLSASDITLSGVSGVSKGTLGGSGPAYTLGISGFTSGGNLNVAVAKSGYTISGSPQSTAIYYSSGSGGGGNTAVTLSNVTANGSSSQTTTQLTLTFSQAITGLSASDITLSGVSGVSKGTLSGSGPAYTLGISGFTSGGTLSVAVAKSGYTISSSPQTVTIFYYSSGSGGGGNTAVTFSSVTANGSSSQTTSQLTLTFSQAITGLSASDITLSGVSGVSKGTLSGGPAYTLGISGFTSGGTLSVAVAKSGYDITGSPKTTTIYYYSAPQAPSAPTGITATISGSNVNLSWSAATGATSYDVYKRNPANATFELKQNVTTRSWTDTSPHPGINRYAIYSKNASGQTSETYGQATSSSVPLATPSINLVSYGTSNNGQTTILVNPVNHATDYMIYYATSASGTFTVLSTTTGDPISGKVNFIARLGTGISGNTFYFKVKAIYEANNSGRVESDQSAAFSYKIP